MNYPPVKYDTISLTGGLDQVTPTLSMTPGSLRRAVNFECAITGGYTRIAGYERFDGRSRPSTASYLVIMCAGSFVVGNLVLGVTSAATAKVIAIIDGGIVVSRVVGFFASAESLTVASVAKGVITAISGSASDGSLDATYLGLAADEYRASIGVVPGSGVVLGLCWFGSKLYAFRNSSDGSTAKMYVSGASGWSEVVFGEEIAFSNANAAVLGATVLTKGGVAATVARVILQTGSWASGVNTGRLVLTGRTGGSFSAGAATSSGTGTLTLSGTQTSIYLKPGGKFQCVVANFGAGALAARMYGADGVNRGFEFDGVNLVPINTGMSVDTPSLIAVHKQHLFLSFGYSLQFSGIGTPFIWTPLAGAGEIAMSADITNIVILPGDQTSGALAALTRNDMSILYGSGASTFALTAFNSGSGAVLGTAQNIDQTYLLNEQGIVSVATTKDFGNFSPSALTMNIRPFINRHLALTTVSGLSRERGQYRVFFSDGFGLYMTMRSGKFVGVAPVQFPHAVRCITEGESLAGDKTSYFGSTNGMVYEMDAGSSFDGAAIAANMTLVFNSSGSHRVLKRYRKASIEVTGNSFASFLLGYDLGYRSVDIEQSSEQLLSNDLRAAYWDNLQWEGFVWDGRDITPTEADMTGTAENVSLRLSCNSATTAPFTVNSITIHHTPRRGLR